MTTFITSSNNGIGTLTAGDSNITVSVLSHTSAIQRELPSGAIVKVSKTSRDIGPKLYFSYVKSKLSTLEKNKLSQRMTKLKSMVMAAKELHQEALYENLALMLAVAMRESEALASGIVKFTERKHVERFIGGVKDRVVKFERFEKFPRIPPYQIREKIGAVQDKKLFDELWIVYIDYTSQDLKTNKEKIRAKDPIVFGCYAYAPERLYFVCDWIDETCNLTLDKMVDALRREDELYALDKIPEMDEAYFEVMKEDVLKRHKRLEDTKSSNFRQHMVEEDKAKALPIVVKKGLIRMLIEVFREWWRA